VLMYLLTLSTLLDLDRETDHLPPSTRPIFNLEECILSADFPLHKLNKKRVVCFQPEPPLTTIVKSLNLVVIFNVL
jgi:hypothetical protein